MRRICSLKTEYFARKPASEVCLRVPEAAENRLRPSSAECVYQWDSRRTQSFIWVGYKQQFNLRKSGFNLREWTLNLRKPGFNLRKRPFKSRRNFPKSNVSNR